MGFRNLFFTFYLSSCTTEIQKSSQTVYFNATDSGYQLVRNSKPFFIKGASGNSFLGEMKAAGSNTLRIYERVNLKGSMDKLESLGLAAVVDLQIPRYNVPKDTFYSNPEHSAKPRLKLEKFVNKCKDHPALLF